MHPTVDSRMYVDSGCRNCFRLNLKSGHANTTHHLSNVIWAQTWLHHFCFVCLYNFVCVASNWTPYLKQFQKLQGGNHPIPPKVIHIYFCFKMITDRRAPINNDVWYRTSKLNSQILVLVTICVSSSWVTLDGSHSLDGPKLLSHVIMRCPQSLCDIIWGH